MRRIDLRGLHVLVVDDNATNQKIIRRFLESWGVRAEVVGSGRAAHARLVEAVADSDRFDAAVLDYQMPDLDGIALAQLIGKTQGLGRLPLLLLTSSGQRGEARRAEGAGFAGYLTKPIQPSQLRDCLVTMLGAGPHTSPTRPIITRYQLAEHARRSQRVLVAEDNSINQRVAVGMLESLGYEVDVVDNGEGAVESAAARPYAAVLMDCQMPGMDGFEATVNIRRSEDGRDRTPIIALTASAMKADELRCLEAGMDACLTKPLRRGELEAALIRWAGAPALPAVDAEVIDATGPSRSLVDDLRLRLDELFEGFGDVADDSAALISSFLRRAADDLAALVAAVADGDVSAAQQRAHSLKGMAGNVGAASMSEVADALESLAREEPNALAVAGRGHIAQLWVELARVDSAARSILSLEDQRGLV